MCEVYRSTSLFRAKRKSYIWNELYIFKCTDYKSKKFSFTK